MSSSTLPRVRVKTRGNKMTIKADSLTRLNKTATLSFSGRRRSQPEANNNNNTILMYTGVCLVTFRGCGRRQRLVLGYCVFIYE